MRCSMSDSDNQNSSLVDEYKKIKPIYEEFTKKMKQLIESLILESDIKILSVTSRTKDEDSLVGKIEKKREKYAKITDITDLSGVRIITYLEEELDKLEQLIGDNFEVLPEFSVNKKQTMEPDRFGYISINYVVKLKPERAELLEYEKYKDLRCEIQIPTILQHAWAEIEHDLGYKTEPELPKKIKREFYRLSGLLELADDEFSRIKKEIDEYTKEVSEKIEESPDKILVDKISLEQYIRSSATVKELDLLFEDLYQSEKSDSIIVNPDELDFFGIKTIRELDDLLNSLKDELVEFSKLYFEKLNALYPSQSYQFHHPGDALIMLYFLKIGKTGDKKQVLDFLDGYGYFMLNEFEKNKRAQLIIEIIQELRENGRIT